MAQVEALNCPSCGGRVDLEEGAQRGRCRSCAAALSLPAPSGIFRYYVEPRIGRAAAVSVAVTATELPVEVIAARLLYVPFWWVTAETAGVVAGQRPIVPAEPGMEGVPAGMVQNLGGEIIKKALWLEQEFRASGVKWPDLAGLAARGDGQAPLQPLAGHNLPGEGAMIEPHDLPAEAVAAEASRTFRGRLLFPYGEYPILRAATGESRTVRRLVYRPVWLVWGFTAQGRLKCLVDAANGDRVHVHLYRRPRPGHPTRYLAAVMAGALALALVYAPTSGYDLRVAAGTLALAGAVWAGVKLRDYAAGRLAERLARLVWGV